MNEQIKLTDWNWKLKGRTESRWRWIEIEQQREQYKNHSPKQNGLVNVQDLDSYSWGKY